MHGFAIPAFESFEALNAYLLQCCRRRMADCLRDHDETIGERLKRDLAALQTSLPAAGAMTTRSKAVEIQVPKPRNRSLLLSPPCPDTSLCALAASYSFGRYIRGFTQQSS